MAIIRRPRRKHPVSARYTVRLIEAFENVGKGGLVLSQSKCIDIARKLTAEMTDYPETIKEATYCLKPKQHAPDCDCGSLMEPIYEEED